ncbi:uncharacterized protein LOC119733871 [Patiria miniata]|uniref:DDE Tnp4 domain-containing protein n=1 Tax=Patiria miniata TaxID=46514 RepID=A0A914AIE1_PATMI|nr:uncharacterized protein LOC119733871 [Patiria miniata]
MTFCFQLIVINDLHRRALRRERLYRDRLNPLENYDETELYRYYRFPRHSILQLTDLISRDLNQTNKNHAVPPVLQVCTALLFYATGVIHNVSGDMSGMIPNTIIKCKTFTNCVIYWAGSTHDSRIFRESAILRSFQHGQVDGYLLGDKGYTLCPYLMTPYINPEGVEQQP